MKNTTIRSILCNMILAAFGLVLFGFGIYLTIQANIGVAPWDAFNLGLSKTFGIKYGTASIAVSLLILCMDIALKEKIGIGMFLDAFIVGKSVDLFNVLQIVPLQSSLPLSLLILLAGLVIMGFSQYLYMKAALGCGPRDTLLVGLSRKITKIPIGIISLCILATVTLIGWLLGGSIGVGTLISAGLEGLIMQWEFKLLRFVPTDVQHQNIIQSAKVVSRRINAMRKG